LVGSRLSVIGLVFCGFILLLGSRYIKKKNGASYGQKVLRIRIILSPVERKDGSLTCDIVYR